MKKEYEEIVKTYKAAQKLKPNQQDDVFFYEVEGEVEGEVYECAFKTPNRNDLSAIMKLNNIDSIKASEWMVENLWLCGDSILRENDKYFIGLHFLIKQIIEYKAGELKKV
jgi:hypothetical protein